MKASMANVLSTQIIPYDFNIFVLVENPTANAGDVKRHGFNLWVGKIPWRRKWHPAPIFLPREPHGQRSLAGYNS